MSRTGASHPSYVLAAAAANFTHHVSRWGGDADSVLGRAGVSHDDLQVPTKAIDLFRYCHLLELAAYDTGNPEFGLHYGRNFTPEMLGLIGFIALASPNLGSALQNFAELFPWHQNGTRTSLIRVGDHLELTYQIVDGNITQRRQDAEFTIAAFANVVRHCLGADWAPVALHFEHEGHGSPTSYFDLFDADVRFSQTTNSLVIRPVDLDRPMPGANLMLLDVLRASLEELASPSEEDDIVAKTAAAIRKHLGSGQLTIGSIAESLKVPVWTLQRQLSDHGYNFSNLLDKVRRDISATYVQQPHVQLSEIAFLLGYSELSAFSRAFRGWYGRSPRQYRQEGRFRGLAVPSMVISRRTDDDE